MPESSWYEAVPKPDNIMEHLQLLRWYREDKLAQNRLELIAKHIDDPKWIEKKEKEWLNEQEYWNGYYGEHYHSFGREWE